MAASLISSLVKLLAVSLLFAISVSAPAQPIGPTSDWDMATDVQRVRSAFNVPGIAIAVVKDGKVLAARGFGVRKVDDDSTPVSGETLFDIAANSKAFTAAMLAMLVDEGRLDWDDPVTQHLPAYQLFDPYATREMTIRDLLSNRSGLGVGAGDLLWWPSTTFSAREIIHKLRFIPPATGFRSRYTYEYLPYIVAGQIVAEKRGKSWGDAVHQLILGPLGMTHTTTSLAEADNVANRAAPHAIVDGKLIIGKRMKMENAAAAMGITTSAVDIAKWMTLLLDRGELAPGADGKERHLYSVAQSREMWAAQTPIRINEPKPLLAGTRPLFAASGMGFELRDYRGIQLAQHGGWQFGFSSTVVLAPSEKLGIAILTNAESSPAMNALKYRLLDHYLHLPPTDWIKAYVDSATADGADEDTPILVTNKKPRPPSLPLAAYDGEYRDAWYGAATIRTAGNAQVLSFSNTPDLTGTMTHYGYDTFIVRWNERSLNADAYVTFSLHPDGSVAGMKMVPISNETDTSFDFQDLHFVPIKPVAPG